MKKRTVLFAVVAMLATILPTIGAGAGGDHPALTPENHDFMYFVAWPDGSHVFTRSLAEHNVAKDDARGERERTGS